MGIFKKPPFLEEAIKRYTYYESGSVERWIMEQTTRGVLDALTGNIKQQKEQDPGHYTNYEKGLISGWNSYLKSRERLEETREQFVNKLEQFLKAIDEIEGRI